MAAMRPKLAPFVAFVTALSQLLETRSYLVRDTSVDGGWEKDTGTLTVQVHDYREASSMLDEEIASLQVSVYLPVCDLNHTSDSRRLQQSAATSGHLGCARCDFRP